MKKYSRKATRTEAEGFRKRAERQLLQVRLGTGEMPAYIVHDGAEVSILSDDQQRAWVTVRVLVRQPRKRLPKPRLAKKENAA